MKKILSGFLVALVLLTGVNKFALADGANVNLMVKNNGAVVYSGNVALLPAGTISINDSSGNPHDTDADSVLSIINTADATSEEFNISNLIYYDTFGAFYLKCMNVSGSELCNNWRYKVNGDSPSVGMDSKILSGGENVVLYFGDENNAPEPDPVPEPETPPAHSSGGSGGGRYLITNTICEQGEKFSVTTGRLCTSFIPAPSLISLPPTLPSLNTNLEEKQKPVLSKIAKKQIKKISKNINQNTATVINATQDTTPKTQTETPKKNWFVRFWDRVFSVF